MDEVRFVPYSHCHVRVTRYMVLIITRYRDYETAWRTSSLVSRWVIHL